MKGVPELGLTPGRLMKNPACQGRRQKGKGKNYRICARKQKILPYALYLYYLMPYPFSLVGGTFSATC